MIEWYTMGADYMDSIAVTERLFDFLIDKQCSAGRDGGHLSRLQPPFKKMTMTEAFAEFADFDLSLHCTGALSSEEERARLREAAENLGLRVSADDSWEVLFNHIFVHQIEPRLPDECPHIIYNYPSGVPALAKPAAEPGRLERWELYAGGIELANCYSEETNPDTVREFFTAETAEKKRALVPVKPDENWRDMYSKNFPECSGTALGIDRLIMLLQGAESLEGVILFPFPDIIPE
jgi:lysyl-tRNA synthetase class 2